MAKKTDTSDEPVQPDPLITIMPLTDFRADPWETGDETVMMFMAGQQSTPVPAAFAKKMRDEGKAE